MTQVKEGAASSVPSGEGEPLDPRIASPERPPVLDGRLELQAILGSGGMATVYRARDRDRGRLCAVKVLGDVLSQDAEFRRRFRREAASAMGLTHPSIVAVYDCGGTALHQYMVMEFVAGGTLYDRLSRPERVSEADALRIGAEVADALAYAHDRGVIHRDIKPHNILLTEDGHVKVADFGIARTLDATSLTRTGAVMGSAHYLAPEQARGDRAGPASDLYALGVVLYEMLAGRVPFDGEAPVAIALKHLNDPPPDLRRIRPDLSPATVALVERLLSKTPEARHPSAAALAADLRRAAARILPRAGETAVLPRPVVGREVGMVPDLSGSPTQALPESGSPTTRLSAGAALAGTEAPGATSVLPATPLSETARMPGTPPAPARARVQPAQRGPGSLLRTPASAISSVLVACVAALVLMGSFGPWVTAHVATPPLVGRTVADANRALRPLHLGAMVASQRQDPRVVSGVIMGQDPPPGRWVLKGSVVRLAVSQGSGIVPDLRGLTVSQATQRLGNAGLGLGRVSYIHDNEIPDGAVIMQFQPPGTHLSPDAPVEILVSLGPPALFPGIPWPFFVPQRGPDENSNK